jgi:hypothetical protein
LNVGQELDFMRFGKIAKPFFMSVRPSAGMEQLGSHWTDFHKILYFSTFRKSVKNFNFE